MCYFPTNTPLHLRARLLRAGVEITLLYPHWVCSGLLLTLLGAFLFPRRLHRAFAWLARLQPLSEHLFQIAGGLLFFFLFLRFVDESLGPSPKAEALAALATVLLILALATQYGRHLFARLKKLGPLELFE